MTPALIATGGTAVAALGMLVDWGLAPSQIKLVSVLGSRQGVERVNTEFPDVQIFIGGVDEELTEKGYISPGLGDAVSPTRIVIIIILHLVAPAAATDSRATGCTVPEPPSSRCRIATRSRRVASARRPVIV